MFSDTQKQQLAADLSRSKVKTRSQSGRSLSYIEGWTAIAEANRIFGFDGWTRETVELRCVAEKEREIGAQKHPGWGVTYVAKVRVKVGDIVREGCGSGHGIDRDLGQAHESALKEAETDAMKRALMTFGNPFGLALYDKDQAHVSDDDAVLTEHSAESAKIADMCIKMIKEAKTAADLTEWYGLDSTKAALKRLTDADYDTVKTTYQQTKKAMGQVENVGAG